MRLVQFTGSTPALILLCLHVFVLLSVNSQCGEALYFILLTYSIASALTIYLQ